MLVQYLELVTNYYSYTSNYFKSIYYIHICYYQLEEIMI